MVNIEMINRSCMRVLLKRRTLALVFFLIKVFDSALSIKNEVSRDLVHSMRAVKPQSPGRHMVMAGGEGGTTLDSAQQWSKGQILSMYLLRTQIYCGDLVQ